MTSFNTHGRVRALEKLFAQVDETVFLENAIHLYSTACVSNRFTRVLGRCSYGVLVIPLTENLTQYYFYYYCHYYCYYMLLLSVSASRLPPRALDT